MAMENPRFALFLSSIIYRSFCPKRFILRFCGSSYSATAQMHQINENQVIFHFWQKNDGNRLLFYLISINNHHYSFSFSRLYFPSDHRSSPWSIQQDYYQRNNTKNRVKQANNHHPNNWRFISKATSKWICRRWSSPRTKINRSLQRCYMYSLLSNIHIC